MPTFKIIMNPSTIHTALWALRQQYAALAATRSPVKGTGDDQLRGLAMVNIRMAMDDLRTQLPPEEQES